MQNSLYFAICPRRACAVARSSRDVRTNICKSNRAAHSYFVPQVQEPCCRKCKSRVAATLSGLAYVPAAHDSGVATTDGCTDAATPPLTTMNFTPAGRRNGAQNRPGRAVALCIIVCDAPAGHTAPGSGAGAADGAGSVAPVRLPSTPPPHAFPGSHVSCPLGLHTPQPPPPHPGAPRDAHCVAGDTRRPGPGPCGRAQPRIASDVLHLGRRI